MSQIIEVSLQPLDSTDMGLVRAWRNQHEIWKWCRQTGPVSDAEQVRWFNRQSEDPTIKMFKIFTAAQAGDEKAAAPVGVCGLTSIDYVNRRAEFSLYVAPECQRKGLGRIGLSLLLNHGFKNLGLNLIWGESFEGNPAIRMFVGLGFSFEGKRRDFYFRDGKFIDAHLFSITAEEWHARSALNPEHSAPDGLPGFDPPMGQAPAVAGTADDEAAQQPQAREEEAYSGY